MPTATRATTDLSEENCRLAKHTNQLKFRTGAITLRINGHVTNYAKPTSGHTELTAASLEGIWTA